MTDFYKIVAVRGGVFCTLFHGIGGTKHLPTGKWIKAENKEGVRDGSGGTTYTSGIHVIRGREACLRYLRRFRRRDLAVVACEVRDIRPKTHSLHPVYLADYVRINYEVTDL